MSEKSTHRKIDWTPEDRARHKAIRERFQRERPTHEQLVASGEYAGPMPLGVYLDLKSALHELRKSREATGLSLAEVARARYVVGRASAVRACPRLATSRRVASQSRMPSRRMSTAAYTYWSLRPTFASQRK